MASVVLITRSGVFLSVAVRANSITSLDLLSNLKGNTKPRTIPLKMKSINTITITHFCLVTRNSTSVCNYW